MKTLEKLGTWLRRRGLAKGKMAYTLRPGDTVTSPQWTLTALEVVAVNWALGAVAVRLGPSGDVVVWPVKGLMKTSR